jgi:hypothetical protein
MSRHSILTFAIVATLALAGCAPSAEPVAEPEVPVVTPTPTRAPETGEAAPAAVFGGGCDAVFTEAQLVEVFAVGGATVGEAGRGPGNPDESLIAQLGGVNCVWDASDVEGTFHYMLYGSVIPAVSVDASDVALNDCYVGPEGYCEFATTSGGLTLSGMLYLKEGSDRAAFDSRIDAVTAAFADSATTQAGYLPPVQAATAWSLDFECSSVQSLVLGGIGSPDLPVLEGGYDAFPTPAERELWGSRDTLACGWLGKNTDPGVSYLSFSFLGGAAWAVDRSGTPYEIEGVDFASSSVDGFQTIEVVDGVNWLQVYVTPGHDPEVKAMIVELLAVLNA